MQKYGSSVGKGLLVAFGAQIINNKLVVSKETNKNTLKMDSDSLTTYKLDNYPNPFNPTTVIRYQIPKDGFVSLKVYDILGREVKTLVNEQKAKGEYKVIFNGSNLASGIYLYRLRAGSTVITKKLLLMK